MSGESIQQSTSADDSEQPIFTKRRCGRLRKEDAQMREQELTVEAKAKRDKRRQDNLKAAARYRHKKDIALKELSEQIEAKDQLLQNAERKILELQRKVEELEIQIALAKRFIDYQKSILDKAGLGERVESAPQMVIGTGGKGSPTVAVKQTAYDGSNVRAPVEMRSNTPVASTSKLPQELTSGSKQDQNILKESAVQGTMPLPKNLPAKFSEEELNAASHIVGLSRVHVPNMESQQRLIEMQRQPTPPMIQGIPKYESLTYGHNLAYTTAPSPRGVEKNISSGSRQLKLPIMKPLTIDEDPLAFLRTNRKRPGRSPQQNFIPPRVSSARLTTANGQPVVLSEVLSKDPNVISNILTSTPYQYNSNRGYVASGVLGPRQAMQ